VSASPQLGLSWALKHSFLQYISRAPGGRGSLTDGATATELDEIVFEPDPRAHAARPDADTFRAFRGIVMFSAHHGMLLVRIADPWVTIDDGRGELTVLDPYQREGDARLRLAVFGMDDHTIADGFERWSATDVRLAPEGCMLFNDVYPEGEPLEPLTITLRTAASLTDGSNA